MSYQINERITEGTVLLSICVPTFNRPGDVARQVAFLLDECRSLAGVEVIVRDNCSDKFSEQRLLANSGGVPFKIFRNKSNLGSVGNLLKLYEDASGAYVWFVGDDDLLYPGVVSAVMDELKGGPNFVMINHRAVDTEGNVRLLSALPAANEFDLLDVFNFSGTTVMFITACVYRKDCLRDALLASNASDRLTAPLFWSLYVAAQGNARFIRQVMIDNVWGATSWSDMQALVFDTLVPQELERSYALGYGKARVFRALLRYRMARLRQRLRGIVFHLLKYARLR